MNFLHICAVTNTKAWFSSFMYLVNNNLKTGELTLVYKFIANKVKSPIFTII